MHKKKQKCIRCTAKLWFKFRCSRRILGSHPRSSLLSLTAISQVCVGTSNSRMWTNYLVDIKKQVDNWLLEVCLGYYFYLFCLHRELCAWHRSVVAVQGVFWGSRWVDGRRRLISRGRWVPPCLSDSARLILARMCVYVYVSVLIREVIHSLGWRAEQMRWKPLSLFLHVDSGVNI